MRPIAEERKVVVRAAWEKLRPRCQELLSLLIEEDPMGYKDISKLLDMPVGSIGPPGHAVSSTCANLSKRLCRIPTMAA